jgi:DNA-binding transcriptional LysR family regulator
MNISGVDLNLFLVFQAVLEEGSTVRAARRLALTQSAVSNALARLRHALGDPLFVRSGRGLVPTPRAEEMRPEVTEALRRLEGLLGDSFDPRTTTRAFTIACADHHQGADVPRLSPSFIASMPRAQLRVVSVDYLLSSDGLVNGTVDAVIAPDGTTGPGLHATPLFRESSGLYVRPGHPALGARLSLKDLEALGHIDVHLTLGRPGDTNRAVQNRLFDLGFVRRIDVITPSFGTAAMIASATDSVAWLPSHAARLYEKLLGLRALRSVLPTFEVGSSLVWHDRTHVDAGTAFFRELVVRALRESPPPARKGRVASRGPRTRLE